MAETTTLSSPPFDSISSVKFSPTNPAHLLVASWDTSVRVYDVNENEQKTKFDHRAAVLDCCFSDDAHAYSGGLDHVVREFDIATETVRYLGTHKDSVSRLTWARELNALITGSWDRTLSFWDPRSSQSQSKTPASSHTLPERVYNLDISGHTLVVAMGSRLFRIYDVRNMASPMQERESSLKYLTRAVACMVDGQGYATGSVEGRIAVEYFDPSPGVQAQKYAFKCHRQSVNDEDHIHPVNSLAFHPIYNTFASCGSDGSVSLWDHKSKKRLRQYHKYPTSVTSLAFNCDGTRLAMGVSYNWETGEKRLGEEERPAVHVRGVGEEAKPKGWGGAA